MAELFLRLVHKSARFDKKRLEAEKKVYEKPSQRTSTPSSLHFFASPNSGAPAAQSAPLEDKHEQESDEEEEMLLGDQNKTEEELKDAQALKEHSLKIKAFRKEQGISVKGSDIPDPVQSFDELTNLGVPAYIVKNLIKPIQEGGFAYTSLTKIQMQSIPILTAGRELLAIAPTGSGKTAAFGIPLFTLLKHPGKEGLRALVLAPTRELEEQIYRVFIRLTAGKPWKIFQLTKANANQNTWSGSKRKDVLISTPLRLVHMLSQGAIDLRSVEYLVLDEADRLFDMGFLEQVDEVMAACSNPKLIKTMFSATMIQGVEALARTVLRDPIRVTIGSKNAAAPTIEQKLVFCGRENGKLLALRELVQQGLKVPVLIFVQSKDRAAQLFKELVYDGLNVDAIHAERTKAQRENIIKKFRSGELWILICTDLMARGIDFRGVNTVINYDFPQSAVSYIHRIGRTGRAGRNGLAITFFTESDQGMLRDVAKIMKTSGVDVPDWMVNLPGLPKNKKELLKNRPPSRPPIATESKSSKGLKKAQKEKEKLKQKKKLKNKKRQAESDVKNGQAAGEDEEKQDKARQNKKLKTKKGQKLSKPQKHEEYDETGFDEERFQDYEPQHGKEEVIEEDVDE